MKKTKATPFDYTKYREICDEVYELSRSGTLERDTYERLRGEAVSTLHFLEPEQRDDLLSNVDMYVSYEWSAPHSAVGRFMLERRAAQQNTLTEVEFFDPKDPALSVQEAAAILSEDFGYRPAYSRAMVRRMRAGSPAEVIIEKDGVKRVYTT